MRHVCEYRFLGDPSGSSETFERNRGGEPQRGFVEPKHTIPTVPTMTAGRAPSPAEERGIFDRRRRIG